MSNRSINATFREVYSLTRLNRGNPHFHQQFFRFRGGNIYVDGTDLVIAPNGRLLTTQPGYVAGCIGGGKFSKSLRRMWLRNSQERGPIPLP